MMRLFHMSAITIFCAFLFTRSENVAATGFDLDWILQSSGAFYTSTPKLSESDNEVIMSYIGDLNCNKQSSLSSCQRFDLVCKRDIPGKIQIKFVGIGVSYIPFSNMLKNSNRFPYIVYSDRLIRTYSRKHGKTDVAYDFQKSIMKAKFRFLSAERLGDFDGGNYAIHWETNSAEDTSRLLNMLASGELLLLAHPASSTFSTYYNRLPPTTGDDIELASAFANSCSVLWEKKQ